jgi:hypothetical protein
MAFRLVNGIGNVNDPAMMNMRASGVVHPGGVVDFGITGGEGVSPAASTSSQSYVFGVAMEYAQGASDVKVNVIPFCDGQIWEADCNRAAATAHINIKHKLLDDKILDLNGTDQDGVNGVFEVLDVVSTGTGSGKVLGRFVRVGRSAG